MRLLSQKFHLKSPLAAILASGATTLALLAGCGPGTAAKSVRGDAPTVGQAMGAGKCTPDEVSPWVVDLPPDKAHQLEAEIKSGQIILVHYDCQELKIVRGCQVKRSEPYAYTGLAFEQRHKELEDADTAHLALSGDPNFAAKVQADYNNGVMLRIDYASIGRRATATRLVYRDMLEGAKCGEATHFLGAMEVGAYSLSSGAAADIGAAAEVFGRGGNASSTSKVKNESSSGDASICKNAKADDPSPPNECSAPLLIQLVPIEAGSSGAGGPPPPPASRRGENAASPYQDKCPPGKVLDPSGSCRTKSKAKAYTCDPSNASECSEQCDKGSPQSCTILGFKYEKGDGVKQDEAKAMSIYKKACDGNDLDGCTGYGYTLSKSDKPDEQSLGGKILSAACDRGSGRACSGIGQRARKARDWQTAYKYFERGCGLGYSRGCYYGGYALLKLEKDDSKALSLMNRACTGGDQRGCLAVGSMIAQGTGGKKDMALGTSYVKYALNALQAECDQKKSESCEVIGDFYNGRYARIAPQGDKAIDYYGLACMGGQGDACWEAGVIFEGGLGGAKKDPAKAKNAFEKACAAGFEDACKKAGKAPPSGPKHH